MKINAKHPLFLVITIISAIILVVIVVKNKPSLEHKPDALPAKPVDVLTVTSMPYRTRVTGYGNVKPAITLNSMAEVSGKISFIHAHLKSGETIPAGTLVVKIDAQDYAVGLKQSQADLAATRSSLKELEEDQKTTLRSLSLAQKTLEVGEAEYARLTEIFTKKVISKSALDQEEQKVIALRQNVSDMQGKINNYKSRRQSVMSQINRAEREVENRQTILGRTEIVLPFDARIGEVNIEKNEFVAVGTKLFEAIDLQGVEITAQLPMSLMRKLVNRLQKNARIGEQVINFNHSLTEQLHLTATVSLVNDLSDAVWEAKVLRISDSIDATRQTLGIVVGVDKPYEKIIPGKRPPLIKGMYTAIEIFAEPYEAIVIPRKAIHQGRVYVANTQQQLEIRPIDIKQTQGNLAVIDSGLIVGEHIILTDLFPVIEGMPLAITQSPLTADKLKAQASGEQ